MYFKSSKLIRFAFGQVLYCDKWYAFIDILWCAVNAVDYAAACVLYPGNRPVRWQPRIPAIRPAVLSNSAQAPPLPLKSIVDLRPLFQKIDQPLLLCDQLVDSRSLPIEKIGYRLLFLISRRKGNFHVSQCGLAQIGLSASGC